jgi:hypothetical protein
VVGLNAGSAIIGKVGIDQTTDGTTNKVNAQNATAANFNAQVVGSVAAAAADSGNPVKVGGIYNSTLPTYTNGQRGDVQIGTRGSVHVELWGSDAATTPTISGSGGDGASNGNALFVTGSRGFLFNGSSWDRAFTCTNTVAVTAAAGTTQLVALSGSTVIRVCNYSLSMAAAGAGTFKFVYGTGSSCGTGTVDITAAMPLAANQNSTASAAPGGSLLRGAAANALCLTVATNTVTGYVTYAQF